MTDADELKRYEITEIFHNSVLPIVELSALKLLFDECAKDVAAALAKEFSLDSEVTVERTFQLGAYDALAPSAGSIAAIYFIAEWNARSVVTLDRTLLFRALDFMCGGDGRGLGRPPSRALTALEQSVADQIGKVVVGRFQDRLAPYVSFGCELERVEETFNPELFVKERSEMVVVALHLTEIDERIVVALPARGLELIRDQISVLVEPEVVDLDPNWSRSLEHSVYKTEVDLVAVAEGPPLLLGDIARMRPGSLIEFDAACLEHVHIESDGETLFQGKLGQSKGYLSICVEAPVSPRDEDE
jgi:flagellar motor switch protein FliM